VFLREGMTEKVPAFLDCGTGSPALVFFPPAAAVVPEDETMPVGGIVICRPPDKIIEDLRIAGVGVAETFNSLS